MQQAKTDGTPSVRQTPLASVAPAGQAQRSAGLSPAPASSQATRVLLTSAQAARDVFGVSERTFHGMRAQPYMPKPVVLGPRLVRWVRSELEQAVLNIPRDQSPTEPHQLLRGKIERMKRTGTSAEVGA